MNPRCQNAKLFLRGPLDRIEVVRTILRLPAKDLARVFDVPPAPAVIGNGVEYVIAKTLRGVEALLDNADAVSVAEVTGIVPHQLGSVRVEDGTQSGTENREPPKI